MASPKRGNENSSLPERSRVPLPNSLENTPSVPALEKKAVTPAGQPRRSLSFGRVSARRSSRGFAFPDTNIRAPATPHGLRAFQRRAAANTPARERRKSIRVQRETPLDILKNLGKALAPTSEIIKSSPSNETEVEPQGSDELDRDSDISVPRLSLPMEEMNVIDDDDGSPEIVPPRLSLLFDEDDITQRSIEMPRRERTAHESAIMSRHSLTSTRFSEHFGDASRMEDTEEGLELEEQYGSFAQDELDITTEHPILDAGGETEDLRRFNFDFSFPTPDAPQFTEVQPEDFVLDATLPLLDYVAISSDSDFGAEGLEPIVAEVLPEASPPQRSPQEGSVDVPWHSLSPKTKKTLKLSKHGTPVPTLPRGIIKRLATRFARTSSAGKTKIPKESLAALERATEWFFEQTSEDLTAYSKHSNRKTIDESDIIALMRRQRQVGKNASVFALAQKHLPAELLQEIRLKE
ncbi:hypothetical protein LOZ03_000725 [Ophidiomyces ophidiicola]|uniref:Uncharacterized protein n=1 Tax=Ophidiomyces ophidiicola TaxID=1387563 RepID=A0ACB8UYV9_9EURO|nr:hypothetical protein LOZ64_002076 [Ophidiomyces ophidiicola]KAI1950074.1 hypothetical protein LOZ62_002057 [Ophidiomyces ophidiicola]KAI1959471.1 hypothetical protein LOZ59_003074 [Ophidiomyces ophidiicola]KAI2040162.1 hypothetical protein LOZ47_001595 [Ophidiomyces ophidiicola]KAI2083134.1 hypothetical protein LOZ37_000392 [Ophidiomyces ophidiicola]